MALNIGLLILRLVIGIILMGHGTQKLFGWFGGPGLKGFSGAPRRMGLRPVMLWTLLAALGESGGGLLLALGLLTQLGALGIMGAMFVAVVKVHLPKGFWNGKGGIEFPLSLWTAAFVLGLTGPGDFSLDHLLPFPSYQPLAFVIASVLLTAVLAVVLQVSKPQPAPAQQSQQAQQPPQTPLAQQPSDQIPQPSQKA